MSNVTIRRGVVAYIWLLFTRWGLFIVIYTLIGVFTNTASPHIPAVAFSAAAFHSWVQYFISILLWPLSLGTPSLPRVNGRLHRALTVLAAQAVGRQRLARYDVGRGAFVSLERCEYRRTELMTVGCPARWKNAGVLLRPGWGTCRWGSAITIGN